MEKGAGVFRGPPVRARARAKPPPCIREPVIFDYRVGIIFSCDHNPLAPSSDLSSSDLFAVASITP